MDSPRPQPGPSATNRALQRFVRFLLRAQVGALLLGVAAGLLPLLWTPSAPTESELVEVAAVAAPEQSVEAVADVGWTDERWELAALRGTLTDPPESEPGNGSIPHPLVDASERLRDSGWEITGFANGDDGQYVEATTDQRIVRVYADAVVLLRAIPDGTGLAEQIGLGLGALIAGMSALQVGGPGRPPWQTRPPGAATNAARVAVACALLLPTGFAIHAAVTGQPIAGWLAMRLPTIGLIVGLVLVLALAAIAAVALVVRSGRDPGNGDLGRADRDSDGDQYGGWYGGTDASSRGPTPRTGPDPW